MKQSLMILTLVVLWTTGQGQGVQKCDSKVLIPVSKNLGNVKQSEISDFLMTFGKTCENNAEFSQWSNELLFDLLDKQTELTLRTLEKEERRIEKGEILEELSSPLLDRVDVKNLRERIEKVPMGLRLKKEIVESLRKAEDKS